MLWGEIGLVLLKTADYPWTFGGESKHFTLQILVAIFITESWDNEPMLPAGCKLVQHFQWVFWPHWPLGSILDTLSHGSKYRYMYIFKDVQCT